MTPDPKFVECLEPPRDLMFRWSHMISQQTISHRLTLAARWGAAQALEAVKESGLIPITHGITWSAGDILPGPAWYRVSHAGNHRTLRIDDKVQVVETSTYTNEIYRQSDATMHDLQDGDGQYVILSATSVDKLDLRSVPLEPTLKERALRDLEGYLDCLRKHGVYLSGDNVRAALEAIK